MSRAAGAECHAAHRVARGVHRRYGYLDTAFSDEELRDVLETLSSDAAARTEFHRHIAAIEGLLSSRRMVTAHGMAVFAASQRNLLQAYALAFRRARDRR